MRSSIPLEKQMARMGLAARATIAGAILAVAVAADLASGPTVSFLLAYVVAVMVAAWYVGVRFAVLVSVLGACGKFAVERPWETGLLGTPVPYWNALARVASFLLIVWVVRLQRSSFDRLRQKADDDASALRTERSLSDSLRKEIEIREAEQRRIGRDLHDGISQHLTATMLASKTLEEQLADRSPAHAAAARQVTGLVSEAMGQVREVSRCLCPNALSAGGLARALGRLAATSERVSGIRCRFSSRSMDLECDESVATHLYRIAQEAVNNSLRHANPRRIVITLSARDGHIELSVSDNGSGAPPPLPDSEGLGLRTMRERARVMGGHLDFRRGPQGGTEVVCIVAPASARGRGAERAHMNGHAAVTAP